MQDYMSSNPMEIVPVEEKDTPHCYYIPHHSVLQPDSLTTKLCFVRNASAQKTTGMSFERAYLHRSKVTTGYPSTFLTRTSVEIFVYC